MPRRPRPHRNDTLRVPRRLRALQVVGRPEPGEAAADHEHVERVVAFQPREVRLGTGFVDPVSGGFVDHPGRRLPVPAALRGRTLIHQAPAAAINPDIDVLQVSARSGEGMAGWIDWLIKASHSAARAEEAAPCHA